MTKSANKIAMLVANPCVTDSRVRKQAFSLAAAGYEVSVLCDSSGTAHVDETERGVSFLRRALTKPSSSGARSGINRASAGEAIALDRRSNSARQARLGAAVAIIDRATFGLLSAVIRWRRSAKLKKQSFNHLAQLKPALVHAHDLETLAAALNAAQYCRCPVIYDAHELETERHGMRPLERWLAGRHEGKLIGRVAQVITVSESIGDELQNKYAIPRPAIILNTPELEAGGREEPGLRAQLELSAEIPLIVYVGKLGPHRGLTCCVEALQLLPAVHFACVGPQNERFASSLRERARALGVADRLHLIDAVAPEQLLSFIASADISVVPTEDVGLSYRYSLPNKLFESTFAGLPLCVSDLPEQRQFVELAGNGVVADMTRADCVAAAISGVLADVSRYRLEPRQMAELAATYSWAAQAECLIRLYAELFAAGDKATAMGNNS